MQPASSSLLRHLDAPVRFLSFTMSDLVAYIMPFFIGALFDSLFVIPGLGLAFVFALKKGAAKFPRFYGIRWLYWSFPTRVFNRALRIDLPHSHKRFWIY